MKPLYSTPIAFRPMKEEPPEWVNEFKRNKPTGPASPYVPGEKCYVREKYANLKALREQAKRLIEQWPYGSYEMPSNIDDGPDVIYKSDWDAQGKKFVGKWIFTTAESARRFVTILSCEPVKVEDVTEEDAIRYGVYKFHSQSKGLEDKPYYRSLYSAQELFKMLWMSKHPGKEWAWRVVSEEEK